MCSIGGIQRGREFFSNKQYFFYGEAVRHTLVFQLARFGDVVQTKRLMGSIAAEPGVKAHLCVDTSLVPLARLLYPFAEVHGLPVHGGKDSNPAELFFRVRKSFAELLAIDFSEVYVLNYSPLSFACASLFPQESLRGYARVDGQEMRGRWTTLAFNLMRDRRFSPINLVDLWAWLHPSPMAPEAVNPIPSPAKSGRVGIVMAGRDSRRSLPSPVLAACVQAIFQARQGPELVCIGSQSERPLVHRLKRHLPPRTAQKVEDRTGTTSLTDLPDLLLGLDVVLTPDTGAMHLAAHLGIPVQAFFLSSAWCFETGPYGFGHKIWQAIESCSPCRESVACPRSLACLEAFSHPSFLAHLSGKYDALWPDGLLGCISRLDSFGVSYFSVDGVDPFAAERIQIRNGLREHLGAVPADGSLLPVPHDVGEFLYSEANWMLPGNWPGA